MLTDNAKKCFESYFLEMELCSLENFYKLDMMMQFGVYQHFFEYVTCTFIGIKRSTLENKYSFFITQVYNTSYKFNTIREAQIECLKKANEKHNYTYPK